MFCPYIAHRYNIQFFYLTFLPYSHFYILNILEYFFHNFLYIYLPLKIQALQHICLFCCCFFTFLSPPNLLTFLFILLLRMFTCLKTFSCTISIEKIFVGWFYQIYIDVSKSSFPKKLNFKWIELCNSLPVCSSEHKSFFL